MSEQVKFFAGAGKCEIEYPLDMFPFQEGPDCWTGIHDVPCVRAVALECAVKTLLISMEVVILERDVEEQVREAAAQLCGIPQEQIWVCATHTVTTPHFFIRPHNSPEENERAARMRGNIVEAARKAVAQANESLREAVMGFGRGTCRANVNRVIETKDGWWLGSGEEWPADHDVPVIRIDDLDAQPIAILYSYNCELAVMDKSVMADGGRHVTADLAGAASRFVEEEYGGQTVALFLPGVSSDQGPAYRAVRTVRGRGGSWRSVDIQDKGWLLLELEGERLGEQVLVAAEGAQCAAPERPILLTHSTHVFPGQKLKGLPNPNRGPAREWPFTPDADRTRSVEFMMLGDVALVCADGVGVETAMTIREKSPFGNTVVLSGISGGAKRLPTDGAKYLAEKIMYERVAFQARNSEFAVGSAEKMLEYVLKLLQNVKGNISQ